MIKLINLSKHYRNFQAVADLSLEVSAGEIYGFLGPNGAGKTTTIRMIAGAMRPSQGQVLVGGYSMVESPEEAKHIIGYIPDRPFLYEKLTGWEFMTFIAGLYRMTDPERDLQGRRLLELFDLSNWSGELIENYSHGMKQRLIMASALMHNPQVLVIDEPMVGLDPGGAKLVMDIFRYLAEEKKVAVFISTHTMSLASRLCDRVGIIFKGRLVAEGTEDDLRAKSGAGGELEELFLNLTGGDGEAHRTLAEMFN